MEKQKNILVFVMNLTPNMVSDVRAFEKEHGKKYRIMLLWDSKIKIPEAKKCHDILVQCDFSSNDKMAAALKPFQDELLAITCRSESSIARFAKLTPHVPYLRTPTSESLLWASDKYLMRRRFRTYDKNITPAFALVANNTAKERVRLAEKVGFPMVVKPTNLAASRFVTICYHEEELEKALRTTFSKLKKAYASDNRIEEPKLLAEEYMDGDMFSIDTYVNSRGTVFHCPLVRVITGKNIGHDDFYNYKQITPTALKKQTIEKAELVAEKAVHALGLRSVTAHIEMMKIDDDWKIIEVGPRAGGFRDTLHRLSCDINHTMNDVLVRIPRKPIIPKKCKGFATAMKWFSDKEGVITEMKGIKKIEELDSFNEIFVNKKIGDRAVFARNGGRSIFNVFLYNADRSKLLADIRRIEQMVDIKIANWTGKKKATKKSSKKTVKKVSAKKPVKKVVKKKT